MLQAWCWNKFIQQYVLLCVMNNPQLSEQGHGLILSLAEFTGSKPWLLQLHLQLLPLSPISHLILDKPLNISLA